MLGGIERRRAGSAICASGSPASGVGGGGRRRRLVTRRRLRATRTRCAVLLDLDLGQAGLVQELGELLDQLAVDRRDFGGFAIARSGSALLSRFLLRASGADEAARPVIASA